MTAFEQLILSTERLLLRPMVAADATALFGMYSDERITRFGSTTPWSSIDTAQQRIVRDQRDMAAAEALRLGIVRAHDQQLIGDCTLFHLDAQCRRAEIGYGLTHAAWGHGYMHEALTALVEYGFSTLNLHRIEADIDPQNSASARSLARLGFQQEGMLRERWIVGDKVSDSAMFGLLEREWRAANEARLDSSILNTPP
jgi:ribosomal-protein-alanine N-acetyltransferase